MIKRALSKKDLKAKSAKRVCDFCDTKMSNTGLESQFKDILEVQMLKLEGLNVDIMALDDKKTKVYADIEEKKR